MFSERLFWDGRAGSPEEQAKQPLTNEFEMGMGSYDAVVERLIGIPQYRRAFRLAFKNEGITIDTIAKAIATYERTHFPGIHLLIGSSRATMMRSPKLRSADGCYSKAKPGG